MSTLLLRLAGPMQSWGTDSKTNALFGSSPLKNLDFMGLFSYH